MFADTALYVGQLLDLAAATVNANSSGSISSSDSTVGGQGTVMTWNRLCADCAATELINVNPSDAYASGFSFYVGTSGVQFSASSHPLDISKNSLDAYVPLIVHNQYVSLKTIVSFTPSKTFSTIQSETHTESDKIWCHDCRAPSQATGAGTGRWIYKDSAGTWRTEDVLLSDRVFSLTLKDTDGHTIHALRSKDNTHVFMIPRTRYGLFHLDVPVHRPVDLFGTSVDDRRYLGARMVFSIIESNGQITPLHVDYPSDTSWYPDGWSKSGSRITLPKDTRMLSVKVIEHVWDMIH